MDTKSSRGITSGFEDWLEKFSKYIPSFIETYHLTYMTLIWSIAIVISGYFAVENLNWLWLTSFMIFMQYVTDFFDGKIGKVRKTGLIKWGYYMDHFLDYIFLGSVGIAYAFLVPSEMYIWLLGIFVVCGGFLINSFLSLTATGNFEIHYLGIGPTEARLFFILVNALVIFFGVEYFILLLPYALYLCILMLVIVVYMTQKKIWKIDEKFKGKLIP